MNYNALAMTMLKLLITTPTLSKLLVPVFNDLVSTLFIAFYSMDNMFSKTNYQKKGNNEVIKGCCLC